MCQKSLEKLSSEACKVVVKTTEKTVCEHRIKENPENLTGTADILEDLIAVSLSISSFDCQDFMGFLLVGESESEVFVRNGR